MTGKSPSHEERTLDDIITAALLRGGGDTVYFLGPYARRISFSAQQNRALNLVYALTERGRLDFDQPVAVIGGGLAGLMVAGTLHALNFKVHLFEQMPTLLSRQRETLHRIVHPSVNNWPFDDILDPTTQFPFFDWAADNCKAVIATILDEWEVVAGRALAEDHRLHLGVRVRKHQVLEDGVRLDATTTAKLPLFGSVVFATGFDDERTIVNGKLKSYWSSTDALEEIRNKSSEARFIVSGTGDGGLIDCLRVVHTKFADGALALRAATELAAACFGKEIGKAEKAFQQSDRKPTAQENLAKVYKTAARALPEALERKLTTSLTDVTLLVRLVGEDENAFARDAAPIHKLLVAHAMRHGAVDYYKGKVELSADPEPNQVTTLKIDGLEDEVTDDVVVARHGASSALQAIIGGRKQAFEELKDAQMVLSDGLVAPFWMGSIGPGPGFPKHDINDRDFLLSRLDKAIGLARIWPHLRFTPTSGGFSMETSEAQGWMPRSLFGVPVMPLPAFPDSGRRP